MDTWNEHPMMPVHFCHKTAPSSFGQDSFPKEGKKTKKKNQTPVMLPIFTLMAADVKLDNASMNFK